jgi:hypothetical protein
MGTVDGCSDKTVALTRVVPVLAAHSTSLMAFATLCQSFHLHFVTSGSQRREDLLFTELGNELFKLQFDLTNW